MHIDLLWPGRQADSGLNLSRLFGKVHQEYRAQQRRQHQTMGHAGSRGLLPGDLYCTRRCHSSQASPRLFHKMAHTLSLHGMHVWLDEDPLSRPLLLVICMLRRQMKWWPFKASGTSSKRRLPWYGALPYWQASSICFEHIKLGNRVCTWKQSLHQRHSERSLCLS